MAAGAPRRAVPRQAVDGQAAARFGQPEGPSVNRSAALVNRPPVGMRHPVREAGEVGPTALAMLELHSEITVLFLDIHMPGEFDGLALAGKIFASRPDIWVMMTSGNVTPATGEILGEGRFVAKPYDGDLVVRMIKALHA